MSHSVTIQTRTVTTGSPSAINMSFCRSWTGMLKIAQVVLGIISVGLIGYSIGKISQHATTVENLFFILIATTFMIASFVLVLSCLCSYTTESIISKTIFELLYHAIAFALLLAASVTLLTDASRYRGYYSNKKDLEMGAAICGLINAALYFISTVFALRTSRGL